MSLKTVCITIFSVATITSAQLFILFSLFVAKIYFYLLESCVGQSLLYGKKIKPSSVLIEYKPNAVFADHWLASQGKLSTKTCNEERSNRFYENAFSIKAKQNCSTGAELNIRKKCLCL